MKCKVNRKKSLLLAGILGFSMVNVANGADYEAPIIFDSGSTTISNDTDTIDLPYIMGQDPAITVENVGTELTLNQMDFEPDDSNYMHVLFASNGGKITVNGGNIKGASAFEAVRSEGDGSEIILNSASISGETTIVADMGGKITVLGTSSAPVYLDAYDSIYGAIVQQESELEIDGAVLTHDSNGDEDAVALLVASDSTATVKNMTIETDATGISVTEGATASFEQGEITSTGDNIYGIITHFEGTTLAVKDTAISTSGTFAIGSETEYGATTDLENVTISTTGMMVYGARIYSAGTLILKDSTITTADSDATGLVLTSSSSDPSTL